jgi:transcription elongation factor Elf1
MSVTVKEQISGTYRCPVCGHRDEVSLDADGGTRILTCSYCDTALEVSARGPDSVRFSVQVAEEPSRG